MRLIQQRKLFDFLIKQIENLILSLRIKKKEKVLMFKLIFSLLLAIYMLCNTTTYSNADEIGIASWYGIPYHGRKTASGETYNMNALTAAHRTLPFNTKLRVTHNNRSVIVTVNDRGPFIKGRILDLSKAAADKIGCVEIGTCFVKIEKL